MANIEYQQKTQGIIGLLSTPLASSLIDVHPNDLGNHEGQEIEAFSGWWDWAQKSEFAWQQLISAYHESLYDSSTDQDLEACKNRIVLPSEISNLISTINSLSLPRNPYPVVSSISREKSEAHEIGMSPKKYHEVSRMSSFVLKYLEKLSNEYGVEVKHIVDIGAGQGHLSRALCSAKDLHILALDSSSHQIKGIEHRSLKFNSKGTLSFKTIWLGEDPSFDNHPGKFGMTSNSYSGSLQYTVDEWLNELEEDTDTSASRTKPICFLALHACGSLSCTVLRKAVEYRRDSKLQQQRGWFTAAAVIVGCCYNLMNNNDFPMSHCVKTQVQDINTDFVLSPSHLQLAAQVPSVWLQSSRSTQETELSIKKVLYRALLTPFLYGSMTSGQLPRLGKLNNKAYTNFKTFLACAQEKLKTRFNIKESSAIDFDTDQISSSALSKRIEVLHTLRCLLGPAIESLIIIDRLFWAQEVSPPLTKTFLVNVFDQLEGSGRNVALVLHM